jgi:uncharacterized membrane protein
MQDELIVAIVAGVCGMLGWGLADFFAKITIDKIGDVTSLAWGHIFGTSVLLVAALFRWTNGGEQIAFSPDFQTWLLLLLFGAAQATVYLFVYKGFGKGQIAVLNPIFASFSGLTAILSVLFFKEVVSGYVLLGLAVIFIGIILISTDFAALRARRFSVAHIPGFKEVGLATLLAAFWTLFWDKFLGGQDWLTYTLFMYAFMTIVILLVAKYQRISLAVTKPGMWKFLALIGLCETVAYLAISLGYSATSFTSIVALLSGAFSLPTIILARLFLKESITGLQTIGGIVVVAGIMLLSLF